MKTSDPVIPKHFYSLDAIRGIAAVIVVLYHWQLFFYADDVYVQGGYEKTALPWYPYLSLFYDNGMVAVDLFFLLSGFIFFWLYAARIAEGKITFGKFFLFRISRLYPIHLFTLLLVAILQWGMLVYYGHYFIILFNDFYHFGLNLLFMQNWGFEKGASFNGPSWSVSVEVFLYLLFYLVCRLKWQSNLGLLALLIPLGAVLQHYDLIIGKGIFSFFLGALVYYFYTWIIRENKVKKYLAVLPTLTALLWVLILTEYQTGYLYQAWMHYQQRWLPGFGHEASQSAYGVVRNLFFRVTVSPCMILTLVLWETGRNAFSKRWAWVGNCSYAIYLLHYPLQIIVVLALKKTGLSREVLSNPLALILFFLVLVPVSVFTYYYFESPVQDKMRKAFTRKRKAVLA